MPRPENTLHTPIRESPPAGENILEVAERFHQAQNLIKEGTIDERELGNRTAEAVARSITGEHGWTATLFGTSPDHLSINARYAYALQNILLPLADWWITAVENAVIHCPAPESAARQSRTKSGRARILRTTGQTYRDSGDLILPTGEWNQVSIVSALNFDGKAAASDIIWPFHLAEVTSILANTFGEALGNPKAYRGMNKGQAGWERFLADSRRPPRNLRVFEDFSGRTPEERQVFTKPTPAPLKPSSTWTTTSHRISTGICRGENCDYEPKVTTTSRRPSGCDAAWRKHSEAVFEAFRKANPEIQYKETHPCLIELRRNRHQCYTRHHTPLRGDPLDHDELCRFPDGDKLIISHPYAREDDTFSTDLAEWQAEVPGTAAKNGGFNRSWYFPGHSTLVIIGKNEALDRVNLEFEIPADTAPTGCVRWRG